MEAKLSKKIGVKYIIAGVIVLTIGVVLYNLRWTLWHYLYVRPWITDWVQRTDQMRVRLLCETDHEVLLEACNELSRQAKSGILKPGIYYIRGATNPEVSKLPKPILDLQPSSVYIDENDSGRVMVEMMGGLDHFGVEAYTEDYKKPYLQYKYGDKELIPRLWYYDDGYIGHPEYEKRIEALITESGDSI